MFGTTCQQIYAFHRFIPRVSVPAYNTLLLTSLQTLLILISPLPPPSALLLSTRLSEALCVNILPSCGAAAPADGNCNTNIEYICIGTDLLSYGTNRKVKWLDRRSTAWLTCNPNRPAPLLSMQLAVRSTKASDDNSCRLRLPALSNVKLLPTSVKSMVSSKRR